MNFLAHLWIADRSGADLAGAVLGDWLRGVLPAELPARLAVSVRLHRRVDAETDRHAVVRAARGRFPSGARRYAGILLDLLYDHLLADGWARYSDEPLPAFADRCAREIALQHRWFRRAGGPVPDARAFSALLLSYGTPQGFERAAHRTARRLRMPEGLLQALDGWDARLPQLREELPELLDDLERLAQDFVAAPQPVPPAPERS